MKKLSVFNKLVIVLLLGGLFILVFQERPKVHKADLVSEQKNGKTIAMAENQLAPEGYAEDLYQSRKQSFSEGDSHNLVTLLTKYSWYEENQGIFNFNEGQIKQVVYGNIQDRVGGYRTSASNDLFLILDEGSEVKVNYRAGNNRLEIELASGKMKVFLPLLKVAEEY